MTTVPKSEVTYSVFCCLKPWCHDTIKKPNSPLCISVCRFHTCSQIDCFQPVKDIGTSVSRLCIDQNCTYRNCMEMKNGTTYCVDHKCNVAGCNSSKQIGCGGGGFGGNPKTGVCRAHWNQKC